MLIYSVLSTVPDNPPGGNPSPMNPVSPPVVGQPIPFNPSGPFPPGKFPRGTAEIPSLPPQHGKVVPPLSPGGPATFVSCKIISSED